MRLYLIRHADPDYERDSLTPAGHLEAQALARRLANEGLDRLYCSPLGRARETARYTADLLGRSPETEHWTRELDHSVDEPSWGRLHICDIPGEVVRCLPPGASHDHWHRRTPYDNPALRQKIEHIRTSSDKFLQRHGYVRQGGRYACAAPHREKVAVFCHAALALVWLGHLLEIPLPLMWAGFFLPPSSVTAVLFEERSREWAAPRCLGLGDVSHLYVAGLPVSTRGLYANLS